MRKEDKRLLREALGAVNPFAFHNEKNELAIYRSAIDAYKEVLLMLWSEFPRGFIDIPYFMVKYQGVAIREAERKCAGRQYALIRLWDRDDKERRSKLKQLLEILLRVNGIHFDETAFTGGLQCFDIFLEKSNISAQTESGAIVDFIQK